MNEVAIVTAMEVPSKEVRIPLPEKLSHVLCSDFDGDGKSDLVATSNNNVYILMNSGGQLSQVVPMGFLPALRLEKAG